MKTPYLLAAFFLGLYGLILISQVATNWENIESFSLLRGPGFRIVLVSVIVYGLATRAPWGWWGGILYSSFVTIMGVTALTLHVISEVRNVQSVSSNLEILILVTTLSLLVIFSLMYPVFKKKQKQ